MEKYEEIQNKNEQIIKKFEAYLNKKGESKKGIAKHLDNIHLLINDYLAIDFEVKPTETDSFQIEEFLNWCIDKWILNTPTELISILNSIKIFFEYLPCHNNQKEKKEILQICEKKDYYLKRFDSQEKILNEY